MRVRIGMLVLLLFAFCAAPALAQYPGSSPYFRPGYGYQPAPTISPYLDIVRGGNPAINYYLGTRPEFERRANAQRFGAAIDELEQRRNMPLADLDEDFPSVGPTGHVAQFANFTPYFNMGNAAGQRYRPNTPGGGQPARQSSGSGTSRRSTTGN